MALKQLQPERVHQARQLDDVLQSLARELDASINPHRLALRALGLDNLGWTKAPYNAEAFQIWSDLLRHNPQDLETLHHLAIMHHARAFDRETNGEATQANADWETALAHWHRLWSADPFWERLVELACRNTKRDAVDALRRDFPILLLQVHYEVAFAAGTPNHRARYHINLVHRSPFPREAVAAVRFNTYQRFIATVPNSVWQMNTLDPPTIKLGTDAIQKYLELDPGCRPALEDALRLQVRLVRAWHTDLQALGSDDSPQRTRLLQTLKEACDHWRPYLDQLVPLAHELDEDLRQKLCLWYRVMAEVRCALDREAEAISLYEQGVRAGDADDGGRKRCVKALGETHAYLAREKAQQKATDARAYCDQARRYAELSIRGHFLLANAYSLLDEFTLAIEVCDKGLQLQPDPGETDFEAIEEFNRGRQHLEEIRTSIEEMSRRHAVHQLLDKATEHMKVERFADAVQLLTQAIRTAPAERMAYFLRCQCYLALEQLSEAQRDLLEFRKGEQSKEARKAADQLEKELNERMKTVGQFGAEGLRLRREANTCFRKDDFARASQLLREGMAKCPTEGRKVLQGELAVVLMAWAAQEVNQAMGDDGKSLAAKEQVCCQALTRLEEAQQLDPSNRNVKQNLLSLRQLAAQVQQAGEAEKKKAELVREYGGERALALQQQAVKAFNADRHDEAIRLLREALTASREDTSPPRLTSRSFLSPTLQNAFRSPLLPPGTEIEGAPALKRELSMVLTGAAIAKVNSAPGNTYVQTKAKEMLQEALQLDPSNTQAMENLTILMRMTGRSF